MLGKHNPAPINVVVQTDWLRDHLTDPDLRIFDCTAHLLPTEPFEQAPYRVVSGRADYEQAHIPGAGFLDLQGELSDNTTRLRFMCPSAEQFAAVMSRHGVGAETRVVLYSTAHMMWATRVWWMLRAFGFDNAAVLDGGWQKWQMEGGPVSTQPCCYLPAEFSARLQQPSLFVDQEQVLAALSDPAVCILNALSPAYHQGTGPSRYGRPGRIAGSVNVPAASLLIPDTQQFIPLTDVKTKFDEVGADPNKMIIVYCGGGISATVDLLLLHRLGYHKLALYDGSLGEWAQNSTLPMERG